jgi:hypothetical protein
MSMPPPQPAHNDLLAPIRWALRVPSLMKGNGREVDQAAHSVLICLAAHARPDGTESRPSLATIAVEARLVADVTVRRKLALLREEGYIEPTGVHGDVTVWRLRMDSVPVEHVVDEATKRREERRLRNAERQRKFRAKAKSGGVTPSESVTVTPSESVTHPVRNDPGGRYVTSSESVSNDPGGRYVTLSGGDRTSLEHPRTSLEHSPAPESGEGPGLFEAPESETNELEARREARNTTAFEEFWSIYPRRVAKGAALKAWTKALRDVPADTVLAGARAYAAAREGQEPRYTKHPTTWLNQGCWDDEHPAAPSTGYRPYENPDQSAYHQDLKELLRG